MKAFAVCVLVACSPPPRPKPAPERDAPDAKPLAPRRGRQFPASPTGFATSDFVTMTGGELTAYAIVDGKLTATGTATLAKLDPDDDEARYVSGIGYGDWADRDHLFLTIGNREVAMVTATAISETQIPSEDLFKTSRPTSTDGVLDRGDTKGGNENGTGLVVTDGQAWWEACPWGLAVDGFQCRQYVSARLWPTTIIEVGKGAVRRREFSWLDAAPAGFTTKPGVDSKWVTCEQGGKKVTISADADATEELDSAHWVSSAPPRLLVLYGHFGFASLITDRWTLHAGCTEEPLATGTYVSPGPGGLWIAHDGDDDKKRQILYRGATPLGALPPNATVYLRPLAKR